MRRSLGLAGAVLVVGLLLGSAGPAAGQGFVFESTPRFDVGIVIEPSGDMVVTETIEQEFGSTPRHGIIRFIPDRLRYDDRYDRIYPIDLVGVTTSPGTPDAVETHEENGNFVIRIGEEDATITGRHTYEIVYRVEGAMNGFEDHDELFWNAIGDQWEQSVDAMHVRIQGPAPIDRIACFVGPTGSTLNCEKSQIKNGVGMFQQTFLGAFNAFSVVIAMPPGTVASTAPILEERWTLDRAFERTPAAIGGGAGLLALVVGGFGWLMWKRGRDQRYAGSQIDQVMGNEGGPEQAVPLFEKDEGPVEFAPPEDVRPGEIGTLIDEEANTLDVTATIIDLAVRKFLQIAEIEKTWFLGKPDWKMTRLGADESQLLGYERELVSGLFEGGDEVLLSDLKKKFAPRLAKVQEALYADMVAKKWFVRSPDKVRGTWSAIGWVAFAAGAGITFVLARWSHLGLLGLPLVLGGLLLVFGAKRMPARTAKGTAMTRRVLGFRTVIETAETHMSRWAEQENVFTRFLPYAIVFDCTDKWAKAFEGLGKMPDDMGWYVSNHSFVYANFAHQMDSFSVTTSGTIASTPAGSGGSGFGGGGGAGGGGGGGGGGSW